MVRISLQITNHERHSYIYKVTEEVALMTWNIMIHIH
jgi:hypothetical protein